MKVVVIINQKGGVGKTTTCINLAAELGLLGHSVLVVDSDPQANTTSGLGWKRDDGLTLYELLTQGGDVIQSVRKTAWQNVSLLPSNLLLAGAELELAAAISREMRLKKLLTPLSGSYDVALVDCPPSLGLLTVNAMAAADELLVPVQCEYYAMEGLSLLKNTIDTVRENLNAKLKISSILLTMYDSRVLLANAVEEQIRHEFSEAVFRTVIPRNVALAEAPSYGQPVCVYRPGCRGCLAYHELALEAEKRWL